MISITADVTHFNVYIYFLPTGIFYISKFRRGETGIRVTLTKREYKYPDKERQNKSKEIMGNEKQ